MGREEQRETLAGLRPEPVPQIDLDAASGEPEDPGIRLVPDGDRRGKSDDDPSGSAFEAGDPDAVPTDVTDSAEYREELAEARRQAKSGEAVLEDGNTDMPPTRYQ